MINESVASDAFISLDFRRPSRQFLAGAAPAAVTLALSALAAAWMLHRLPVPVAAPPVVRAPAAAFKPAAPAPTVVASPYGILFDPGFSSGSAPFSAAQRAAAASGPQPVSPVLSAAIPAPENAPPAPKPIASLTSDSAPLPPPRPAELALPANPPLVVRRFAQSSKAVAAAAPPPDNRGFFEKLFGAAKPAGPALAYASADGGLFGGALGGASGPSSRYDRWTAVYDVAAHTVYLPNGTRLEAHSGLGDRLDDPNHVNERNRGATPPHVYELAPREQSFHGVQALRLNPVGGGDVFGRAGLLAHSYMLGPNGDSNGCVSFRNYDAFLQAYQNGEVKRLAVVARLD
jgi:Protein of unknown function (DUF2778)